MSALYLSKVAPQESTLSKPEQDQSCESGKRTKPTKMAEDSTYQQRKDDLPPPPSARHQPGTADISGAHHQPSMPSQLSKERLYQQRQKCELRRLLKHTHPELKMLDDVVDEELAEVLSSEEVTAGETGYEGEVLSRCLIFENCSQSNKVSPNTPKMHMAEGTAERCDFSEEPKMGLHTENVKGIAADSKPLCFSPEPNSECEEEMIRIDVQATRRMFESQSANTSWPNPDNKKHGKVSISADDTKPAQKQKKPFEMCSKDSLQSGNKSRGTDSEEQPHKQLSCAHAAGQQAEHDFSDSKEVSTGETFFEKESTNFPDSERFSETIKTSAALFQNNPFISTNIDREYSYVHTSKTPIPAIDSGAGEENLTANVKNRTHLFESMPFDKIRHQNRDEIETMVENIKETLNFLYHGNAIHSAGSVIEVNETMIAKKAKFALSESGPQIKYDEVAEGGAQNFIVQLLPRVNLKPQITYLKEDSKRCMEATVVNVPVHQHQFNTNKDTEFKTANVVQLIEDILNQDNSLRKGVIIQEEANNCAKVMVYSLYNYFDEEDVKSYSPPQCAECDKTEAERGDISAPESTIRNFQEMSQTCPGSIRPEVTVKGNVKLFKSCIEKGDLEYLKSLQAEPTVQEQELPPNQTVVELPHEPRGNQAEESTSEWVPVDVKKLKSMFSGDQSKIQPKKNIQENQSAIISHTVTSQDVSRGKRQSSAECSIEVFPHGQVKNTIEEFGGQVQEEECTFKVVPQASSPHLDTYDDDRVHQAELVEVVDDSNEISNLQTAIQSLQQATIEAKSLYYSSQEKQKIPSEESLEEFIVSVTADNGKHSRTEAETPQENQDRKVVEPQATSSFTSGHESDCQDKKIETCHKETQATETCTKKGRKEEEEVVQKQHDQGATASATTKAQQEEEEVVFEGKIQAALESLERSNINVKQGDFRAAMIYRNSSKPHQERLQNMDVVSAQKEFCTMSEPESTHMQLRQEVTAADAEPLHQPETVNETPTSAITEKKRPTGPKPAIPPKPEHLKVKQRDSTENLKTTQTHTVQPSETLPQLPPSPISCKDKHKQNLLETDSIVGSGLGSVDQQTDDVLVPLVPQMSLKTQTQMRHEGHGSVGSFESDSIHNSISGEQKMTATAEVKNPQDLPVKVSINEADESPVDFNQARQKFEGKKAFSMKIAPAKPKRVKITQPDNKNPKSGDNVQPQPVQIITEPSSNTCGQTAKKEIKQESKVEMREKKGRIETEDERRQRLSVHMDEIMKGNITAAMEIFDNLRKQEELHSILSRVEEIEEETSDVDVRSLRKVFENVPEWVVSTNKKKQKMVKVENKDEKLPLPRDNTESKSSMAHVFGDLERASEEIMNLKEQTLARLIDIEEAIKKALYSVSTLRSDSDIAGLSCLFKESLGAVKGSTSSGNISKISIESSRTKPQLAQKILSSQRNTSKPAGQEASAKQQASPPSSPAFISIQSAARKTDKTDVVSSETSTHPTYQQSPKLEEKFRTTKTLTCNSPAQNRRRDARQGGQKQSTHSPPNSNRELSVLQVQTDHDGNSIIGTKTVTENYERTDNFGNRFYSSKTSTVVTTQPETMMSSTTKTVMSPATYQVTTYPEVQLPINQISTLMPK